MLEKDLEAAILELGNAKQYHQNTRDFLSLLESRRVLYSGIDHEFPDRVLESLEMIRFNIVSIRASVPGDSKLALSAYLLQKSIDRFLKKMGAINLKVLKCDGGNPDWIKFSTELKKLREEVMLIVRVLATSAGYEFKFLDQD